MTRVLVLGTVPPKGGPRAAALRRLVADHLAMGDSVEVWSQSELAAAHVHEARTGLALLARLAVAVPRFDVLVLRIQPGWPFHGEEGRRVRAAFFLGLGVLLHRLDQVVVVLDSPIAIPGGVGGRPTKELWSRAEVVVETEEDRAELLAIPWLDPARVRVVPPPPEARAAPLPTWPKPDTPDLRAAVLGVVRVRATVERRLRMAGSQLAARLPPAPPRPAEKAGKHGRVEQREPAALDLDAAFEAAYRPRPRRRRARVAVVARKVKGRLRRALRR